MNEWIIELLGISFPDSYSYVPPITPFSFLYFHWSENLKISFQTLKIKQQWAFRWVEIKETAWEEGRAERFSRQRNWGRDLFCTVVKDTQYKELSLMLHWFLVSRDRKARANPLPSAGPGPHIAFGVQPQPVLQNRGKLLSRKCGCLIQNLFWISFVTNHSS